MLQLPNMSAHISRRDALKLGLLSLSRIAGRLPGVSPPWQDDEIFPLFIGRVAASAIYIYSEPRFDAERNGKLHRDDLLSILEEVTGLNGPMHNPLWYRISSGFIFSGGIQRIQVKPPNPPLASIPVTGHLCEVSAPYTQAFSYTQAGEWKPVYRLYAESVHWIYGMETGPDGGPWYRIQEHYPDYTYYAPAADLRPIPAAEYLPVSRDVPPDEKRIEISIAGQSLTAFERGKPVLQTLVSTGLPSRDNLPESEIPTDTPIGSFRIQSKMPSRHMGDGRLTSDINAYELPGVPWTMIFHEDGIALHGTYWHNNFGTRMSHGCVNMRNADVKWLFRWTDPAFMPFDWYKRETGTLVIVS